MMPAMRTMAPEYFSLVSLVSSRLIIILIMNMQITRNTACRYHVCRENGFRKISSLILLVEVDSSMKQGLREKEISLKPIRAEAARAIWRRSDDEYIPNRPRRADESGIIQSLGHHDPRIAGEVDVIRVQDLEYQAVHAVAIPVNYLRRVYA